MKKIIFCLFVSFIFLKSFLFSMVPSKSKDKLLEETFKTDVSMEDVNKVVSSIDRRKMFKRRSSSLRECTFNKDSSDTYNSDETEN